jgi:hypothetical protein
MYVEWTNNERQHCKTRSFLKQIEFISFDEETEKGVQMEEVYDQVVLHTNIVLGKKFPYIFLVQRLMVIYKNEFVAFSKLE